MHLCMHKHHELNNLGSTKKYKKRKSFVAKFCFKLRPPERWPMSQFCVILPANYLSCKNVSSFFVFGVSSFPTSWRVNEKACPHVQHTNSLSAPFIICFHNQCVCVVVVCFQVGFCFHAFLSVSDKSFDSRFVFVLIYCHTQTFFFAFSLALFLSVTLNVILYFTNRLQSNSSTQSPFLLFSLSHCNVCFNVSASFVFCIILDSVQSVFDLLCWLLFVKHTFNSSILYCICFPFFLSCFYTSVFVYVCVCVFLNDGKWLTVYKHIHTATHTHTHTCLPSLYRLEATNRCAIDGFQLSLRKVYNVVELGWCLEWSTCDNWLNFSAPPTSDICRAESFEIFKNYHHCWQEEWESLKKIYFYFKI